MATVDTLKAYETLTGADMPDRQARALITIVQELQETRLAEVAGKGDIAALKTSVKEDIAALKTSVNEDIAEIKADIAAFKAEVKGDIAEIRAESPLLRPRSGGISPKSKPIGRVQGRDQGGYGGPAQ